MKNFKISFIGGGNMAEALLSGAIKSRVLIPDNITICDINEKRLKYLENKYSVKTTSLSKKAVQFADIIILSVKPQYFLNAIDGVADIFADKAVISIMAGINTKTLAKNLHTSARILRVMPNTPAQVGEGITVLCENNTIKDDELEFTQNIFSSVGSYLVLDEKYMDIVTGISGSGPAYVYMFIEAMSDAGVLNGLPREISYKLAAQTVLGAAKTVIETNIHPATLKDMVSSPGGTTIEAIASLENDGFRNAVINAVNKSTAKSKSLSERK